ncbi:MAG: hypothetical protein M0R80_01460 [Proteobacteria bacterium]|jgi:hypothetical protein|nr:hypothetical protein [Pseudomonadota bacterium]
MRIGLEKEFFLLTKDGEPVSLAAVNPTGTGGHSLLRLPHDDCGWLVEARGEPFSNPVDAVFSLKAEIYKIEQTLAEINAETFFAGLPFRLSDVPIMKVPKTVRLQSARYFTKPLVKYQNFYGYETHKNAMLEGTAGVHVSFTQETSFTEDACESCGHCKERIYNVNFDWPQIFLKLDAAFAEEIKEAKRRPGFYEIKHDGRVEYRSLPADVDMEKLIKILKTVVYT